MNILTGIIGTILILALYFFLKYRHKKDNINPDTQRQNRGSKFRAVSLKFSVDSCQAAKKMQDIRFFPNDAPRLPLPECDALKCTCKFERHKDRRTGEYRRSPYGESFGNDKLGQFEKSKRKHGDRRKK